MTVEVGGGSITFVDPNIIKKKRSETMRLIRHSIALAAAPQDRRVTTTGDLIELCSVSADDPLYAAALGAAVGGAGGYLYNRHEESQGN